MKKILILFAIAVNTFLLTNCEKNDDSPAILSIDYLGFESGFVVGVDPSATESQEVKIATSQTASTDRSFNIVVVSSLTTADASAYSVPGSVTIPANSNVGTFNIQIVGPNINSSGNDILAIGFTSPEDGSYIGDPISLNLKQVCPNPELILSITFDDYPEEIYWSITDSSDNTVFESATPAAYGAYDGLTGSISRAMCLASGSYTFTIYDGYQDGAGPVSLTFDGNVLFSSDGAYGAGTAFSFTIP